LVVGNALDVPVEFMERSEQEDNPVTGMRPMAPMTSRQAISQTIPP